jgi:hypothetical protein
MELNVVLQNPIWCAGAERVSKSEWYRSPWGPEAWPLEPQHCAVITMPHVPPPEESVSAFHRFNYLWNFLRKTGNHRVRVESVRCDTQQYVHSFANPFVLILILFWGNGTFVLRLHFSSCNNSTIWKYLIFWRCCKVSVYLNDSNRSGLFMITIQFKNVLFSCKRIRLSALLFVYEICFLPYLKNTYWR